MRDWARGTSRDHSEGRRDSVLPCHVELSLRNDGFPKTAFRATEGVLYSSSVCTWRHCRPCAGKGLQAEAAGAGLWAPVMVPRTAGSPEPVPLCGSLPVLFRPCLSSSLAAVVGGDSFPGRIS